MLTKEKRSSLLKMRINLHKKSFMKLNPGANLIIYFWRNFSYTFCKLDHCFNADVIFLCFEKM
jgi:hypothetical protein